MKIIITENQYNLIIENIDEINEILDLSDYITDKIISHYNNDFLNALKNAKHNKYISIDIKNTSFYLKNIVTDNDYDLINNFINATVIIQLKKHSPYAGGEYHKKENVLIIYINDGQINRKFYEHFKKTNFNVNNYILNLFIDQYRKSITSSISHELQHAYDNFRSNGNFDNNKKASKYLSLWNQKNLSFDKYPGNINNLYLKLPHEIWGRFTQYISDTNMDEMTPNVLIKHFIKNFPGYDIINKDTQKRLINAIYKYYIDITNKN